MPKDDYQLHWKDRKGIVSEHRVRIFNGLDSADGLKVIVITEELDAEGVSVTNGCEEIANLILENKGIDHNAVCFIEHYERGGKESDDFATIGFVWDTHNKRVKSPRWRYATHLEVECMCGETIS